LKQTTKIFKQTCAPHLRISCTAQYYSKRGGKLLQPHPIITPVSVANAWDFVDGRRTRKHGTYKRPIITPVDFEITPIIVEKTLAIIGRQENEVAGVDLPAIEIYYYSIAEYEGHEITPIRSLRTCKTGGFYGGRGSARGALETMN